MTRHFSIFLIGLLLLIPVHVTLAVWDAEVTYYGETVDTGYSWNQSLPVTYTWDDTAWDFIYGVELVDNESSNPDDYPLDKFWIENPYLATFTITLTPEGWWPSAGMTSNNDTINWMTYNEVIYEGDPAKYFAYTVDANSGIHPGTVMLHSSNHGHTNPDHGPGPTPEPATLLLLGSGLVGIGILYRKKSKKETQ